MCHIPTYTHPHSHACNMRLRWEHKVSEKHLSNVNSPDTHKLFNVYSIGLDVVFIGSFHFEWNINCIIQFDGRLVHTRTYSA